MYNLIDEQDASASCSGGTSLPRCEARYKARSDAELAYDNWKAAQATCIMADCCDEDEVIGHTKCLKF